MNKKTKNVYYLTLSIILFFTLGACNNLTGQGKAADSPFKKSLTQRKIAGANCLISLPAKYTVKESRGVDFSVYYFYPADTTNKTGFRGGFYLGNFPNGVSVDSTCKVEEKESYMLGANKKWSVYNCKSTYKIQIVLPTNSGYDWEHYIHAFGSAISKEELEKLFDIYSTLIITPKK